MKTGTRDAPAKIDALMRPFCQRLGVEYISPCEILGGRDGFLVRLGDTADSLVAFDYGHLTKVGSEYLVSRFPRD
jgi:hypothetical protein